MSATMLLRLLRRADANGGTVTTRVVCGRGVRDDDAARAAMAAGLLEQVEHHAGFDPGSASRRAAHYSETLYRITPAGRALAEAHARKATLSTRHWSTLRVGDRAAIRGVRSNLDARRRMVGTVLAVTVRRSARRSALLDCGGHRYRWVPMSHLIPLDDDDRGQTA